ncbi:class I SAM-dependent methyltransferase [Variibacter gotjawalensis]|uniref:class I SAM-dependent methyltransferase n=1 Tax=Variibacter gotjawalensis TaxID=1333996 RepID=UPI00102AAC9A|nr:class I SAM-dependent methyltransferase [Variibacter gotjawalensis]NIK46334.1 SAM-dependent methyltransferase [Variibacter gotjawalensis]
MREPYDLRARNADVLSAVAKQFDALPSLRITDLACGTGSTARAVGPRFKQPQMWKLVDNDLSLLARAGVDAAGPNRKIITQPVDLAFDVEAALDGPIDLVTTSALLDLVSEEWLERLATELAARRLPFYAALSYDGRVEISPSDPLDRPVVDAVNLHQKSDKGFGPALGPNAATAAVRQFENVGYEVVSGPADWVFETFDTAIQKATLAGWAVAATEIDSSLRLKTSAWLERRDERIEAAESRIVVGHIDFFARPTT